MHQLSVLFPDLKFAATADNFLTTVPHKQLRAQLLERHIYELREDSLLFSAAGLCRRPSGGFFIQFNSMVDLNQKIFSCGHEIGHTFHFDVQRGSKRHPLLLLSRRITDTMYDLVEQFCDAFSERWLALQQPESVGKLIESELRMNSSLTHRCYHSVE